MMLDNDGSYDRFSNMYHISFKHVCHVEGLVASRGTVIYKESLVDVTTTQFIQNIAPKLLVDFPFHRSRADFDIVPGFYYTGLNEFVSMPLEENDVFVTDLISHDILKYLTFYVRSKPHVLQLHEPIAPSSADSAQTVCLLCQSLTHRRFRYNCMPPRETNQHFICDACYTSCHTAGHMRCSFCRAGMRRDVYLRA